MRAWGIAAVLVLLVASCTDDDSPSSQDSGAPAPSTAGSVAASSTVTAATTSATTPVPVSAPPSEPATTELASEEQLATIASVLEESPPGCDALDTRHCYLPYPSNAHTVPDPDSATGLRVAFPERRGPTNAGGSTLDVAEWNRSDGFSPNAPIITYVPGLDDEQTDLPSWADLGASLDADVPVVLVDADTGERIALWAELDAKAPRPADRTLMIRPASSLPEGHTFVVALRGLRDAAGDLITPNPVFAAYRGRFNTRIDRLERRRPEMEQAFATLADAGVEREDLQLAWTFTTISTGDLTGRLQHIRDETLAELGDAAPAFEVTDLLERPEPGIARQISGTFTVTNWLTGGGGPGEGYHYASRSPGAGELPTPNGTVEAPFRCDVTEQVLAARRPARFVLYGHGLLGGEDEVGAGNLGDFADEHGVVFCATKWAGMSSDDIGNAVASLEDMSNFPTLADRLQQGLLNQVVLGRLMLADGGLGDDPSLARPDGSPIVDHREITYDGNSQGAIMGLALAGISPDIERFVLGVAGMNYSTLLSRSVDFDTYETIFEPAYQDPFERTLLIAMIQMLWDRGEGAGYVQHVTTDPLPGTPAKDVLVHVAFGDWQVSELTAYVEARSMGLPVHRPVTAPGRSGETDPGWGLAPIAYPSESGGLVVWDSGSDPIPFENLAPRTSRDPHEDPRADADVRRQKAAFLFDGRLIDVCDGRPCTADRVD